MKIPKLDASTFPAPYNTILIEDRTQKVYEVVSTKDDHSDIIAHLLLNILQLPLEKVTVPGRNAYMCRVDGIPILIKGLPKNVEIDTLIQKIPHKKLVEIFATFPNHSSIKFKIVNVTPTTGDILISLSLFPIPIKALEFYTDSPNYGKLVLTILFARIQNLVGNAKRIISMFDVDTKVKLTVPEEQLVLPLEFESPNEAPVAEATHEDFFSI